MARTRSMYLVADVVSYARCLILTLRLGSTALTGRDWDGKAREGKMYVRVGLSYYYCMFHLNEDGWSSGDS
jgi:hypothetical protein